MYDGSAGFDLPDAIYLGKALSDLGYLWYEEPMREFSIGVGGHISTYASAAALYEVGFNHFFRGRRRL